MGQNLYWAPIIKREGHNLPDQLKFILRKKFDLYGNGYNFVRADLSYLRGLSDAGVEGAKELMDAIEKHEEIRVYLE